MQTKETTGDVGNRRESGSKRVKTEMMSGSKLVKVQGPGASRDWTPQGAGRSAEILGLEGGIPPHGAWCPPRLRRDPLGCWRWNGGNIPKTPPLTSGARQTPGPPRGAGWPRSRFLARGPQGALARGTWWGRRRGGAGFAVDQAGDFSGCFFGGGMDMNNELNKTTPWFCVSGPKSTL
jgi:hypothetical protein